MKMRNILGSVAVLAMVCGFVRAADMDSVEISTGAVVTNGGTHAGTAGYIVRGIIEGVTVKCSAGGTNTVTLSSANGQTIFSKSDCAGTNTYVLRTPVHLASSGAALTDTLYAYNSITNASYTVPLYGGVPCASKVTLSVVGAGSGTTTCSVVLMYR